MVLAVTSSSTFFTRACVSASDGPFEKTLRRIGLFRAATCCALWAFSDRQSSNAFFRSFRPSSAGKRRAAGQAHQRLRSFVAVEKLRDHVIVDQAKHEVGL
jgi:hypothetical protein